MNNGCMMRVGAWMLMMLMVMGALLGCSATDAGEQSDTEVPPMLENNRVAEIAFTAMWYRENFDAEGFQITDGYTAQCILAQFNNVEFRPLTEEEMRDVYLEVGPAQFIMLEGGATVYVSDAGRAMLTIADGGQYVTEQGAVDAAALHSIAMTLAPDAQSVE